VTEECLIPPLFSVSEKWSNRRPNNAGIRRYCKLAESAKVLSCFSGCPPLAELPQQLHLSGLAGGILVGTRQPQLLPTAFRFQNLRGLRFVATIGRAACSFAQISPLRPTGGFFLGAASRTAGPTAGAFEAYCFL
jgi:hypothetical protein